MVLCCNVMLLPLFEVDLTFFIYSKNLRFCRELQKRDNANPRKQTPPKSTQTHTFN